MATLRATFVLCISTALLARASPDHLHNRNAHPFPITARALDLPLRPRQTTATPENPGQSVCGYRNGNLERSWVAPEGSRCFLDHTASYFGWCNVLLSKAEDCTDVFRACVDSSTCSGGCGKTSQSDVPTITCTKESSYCYSNLLVTQEQTYTYLGCDLTRTPLIYSPAAGILDALSTAPATPTASTTLPSVSLLLSASVFTPTTTTGPAQSPSANRPPQQTVDGAPTTTSSKSTNAGAIAGSVVGGLAVVAIAGLVFFFMRRRFAGAHKKDAAELGPPDYQESHAPPEKYAYRSELPGAVAATELPSQPHEPAELHGDATPPKTGNQGN